MGSVLIGCMIWDTSWDVPWDVLRLMGRLMGWPSMEFHPWEILWEVPYDIASFYCPMSGPIGLPVRCPMGSMFRPTQVPRHVR